jgi:hypothetical protein
MTSMVDDVAPREAIATAPRGLSRRRSQTRRLLRCGALTGPLFVAMTAASALTQPGFDLRRHGISLLSLGDRGWIQVANFVVAGALSVAFGEGVRRLLAGRPDEIGRSLAAPLVFAYGAGLLGTGLFLVDPYLGFPAGAPPEYLPAMSWHGAVHAAGPPVAFFSLIGLCAVFARRYLAQRRPWRAAWSVATGVGIGGLIVWPGGGASVRSAVAVLLASAWMTAVALDLLRGSVGSPASPGDSVSNRTVGGA